MKKNGETVEEQERDEKEILKTAWAGE